MDFYNEDGGKVGIYDVCRWWIGNYPDTVFVTEPKQVVKVRESMEIILKDAGEV